MKKRSRSQAYPVVRVLKGTLWIAIPVLVVFMIVSAFSFIEIRKQNSLAVENAVNIYQTELEHKLSAIEHFVQWTVVHDPILDAYSLDKHMGDYVKAGSDLRLRVSDMQYSTGSEFKYFFFWDEGDLFINASEFDMSYETYKHIRDKVKSDVYGKSAGERIFTWVPCVIDEKTYLYYRITYMHRTFVSLVPIEDLLTPLGSLNLGSHGNIQVQSLSGEAFYETAKAPAGLLSRYYDKLDFPGKKSNLPFTLVIDSDMLGNYGKIFLFQFIIFLTALTLSFIMGGYVLLTYRKVILPIKIFSDNLSRLDSLPDSEATAIDLTDSKVQELNQINDQFKSLIHEITRLRINVYEAELDQNKFLIHFLQQQIKPHFYLNCLTTIDSCVSLGDIDAAKKMLQFTSRYFRYLFQADKDFVLLSDELSHVKDYMDIQNMRLSQAIEYDCSVDEKHLMIKIPPLILITFVENIVKHADPGESPLQVNISCKELKEDPRFEVVISDNGQGFPQDILEMINEGKELTKNGEHIGITNCMRRLSLLYDKSYSLDFENPAAGGAMVTLRIPMLR